MLGNCVAQKRRSSQQHYDYLPVHMCVCVTLSIKIKHVECSQVSTVST